jgi:hypothetical protein
LDHRSTFTRFIFSISVIDGPQLLSSPLALAAKDWKFHPQDFGKSIQAAVDYQLNCKVPAK